MNAQTNNTITCQKCGTNTELGECYRFHYGKYTGNTLLGIKVEKYYQIAGSEFVDLCERCVAKSNLGDTYALIVIFFVFMLPSFFLFGISSETLIAGLFFIGIGVGLFFTILYLIYRVIQIQRNNEDVIDSEILRLDRIKKLESTGDLLAIKVRRSYLEQAGNDSFFTRDQYAKLKITNFGHK